MPVIKLFCNKKGQEILSINCSYLDPKMCPYFKGCNMGYLEKTKEVIDARRKKGGEDIILH